MSRLRSKTVETQLTSADNKRIQEGIRGKYNQAAVNPKGLFSYPTGRDGLKALGYDPDLVKDLPDAVAASYCGVGNPFSLGTVMKGTSVLDIGCGAGVDTILAARMVGPNGRAVGIDLVSEMLERGKNNLGMTDLKNVSFIEGSANKLDFPDESFDVVVSNGVFNLIPAKEAAIAEAFRLLKPGGRFMIADQVLVGELQKDLKTRIDTWFQ